MFAEAAVAFLLLVKIGPLRELVLKSLDQIKIGKGPAYVKTISGTMFVILLSYLMSIVKIQNKGAKLGSLSPMDQVLWRSHLLEALLIGKLKYQHRTRSFTLFLGFVIDRMHHYLKKLISLKGNAGASKKENVQLKENEEKSSKETKQLQEKISALSEELKKLKIESEEKDKKIETAEAHVTSLQKQSADLLLEYDRLLEDNQNLQAHAQGYRR
ncbi:hypothetical protein LINPERHAP1_LOCUS10289 [Linum perenne]